MQRIATSLFVTLIACFALAAALFPYVGWADNTAGQSLRIGPMGGGTWQLGDNTYPTLKDAVDSVSPGGEATITLAGGGVDENVAFTIPSGKNITLDLGGNTVNVSLGDTKKTFIAVASGATLTVNGNGGTFQGNQDGRAISASGTLNIKDATFDGFTSSGNGGAVFMQQGVLTAASCTFSNNTCTNAGTITTQVSPSASEGGGAISLEQRCSADFNNCSFINNTSKYLGGAVNIFEAGDISFSGCTIAENTAFARGGGMHAYGFKGLTLDGCTIDANKVYYEAPVTNSVNFAGDGGGLALVFPTSTTDSKCLIKDTSIIKNVATHPTDTNANYIYNGRGGGIWYAKLSSDSSMEFDNVVIAENEAWMGGGIDYTIHIQTPLELPNTLITGNKAPRGGGVWICPDGSLNFYATLSGSIQDNIAEGGPVEALTSYEMLGAAGSDIVKEGRDSKDVSLVSRKWGYVYVAERDSFGNPIHWYKDEADARYQDGDEVADPAYYRATSYSFALHRGEPFADKAEDDYTLVIKNNIAYTRGGGIATNSPIQMGKDEDTRLYAKKEWTTSEPPAFAQFNLYREANGERELIETVTVNENTNWEYRFASLPAYSIDSNGVRTDYTWSIEEAPMTGWAATRVLNIHQWIDEDEGTEEDPRYFHEDYTDAEFSTLVISGTAEPNTEKKFAFYVSDNGGEPYLYHEPWYDKDAEFTVTTDASGKWKVDGSRVPLWACGLDDDGEPDYDDDWNVTERTYTFMEWDEDAEKYVPVFTHDYQWGDDSKWGTRDYTMVINAPVEPIEETLPITKKVEGNPPADETFTFSITAASEGAPMPATTQATIKGAGTANFGSIKFEQAGTYAYTVAETAGTAEGYTYDPSTYTVTYKVTLDGTTLSANRTINKGEDTPEAIEFVNTYKEPGSDPEPDPEPSTPVDVVLVKHLVDALIHPEEFSFGLYDEEGKLLDTVHTTLGTHTSPSTDEYSSYVEIAFKDLVFSEAGTYNYTIREHMDGTTEVKEGDEFNLQGFEPGFYKGGVKYDDKEYRVVVVVRDNDGQLVATPTYPDSDGTPNVELFNEYSEEYVEIDGNDEHPNDGRHEDPKKPEEPKTDKPTTPLKTQTPAASPKPTIQGTARTFDGAPLAALGLVAVLSAACLGLSRAFRK